MEIKNIRTFKPWMISGEEYNWRIVDFVESRDIEIVRDEAGNITDSTPINDSYEGRLVLERNDGAIVEFKLGL